jgi:hypothetical protein
VPYYQYLRKYCQLRQLKIELPGRCQQIAFMEFNLLALAVATLAKPIREFAGFLSKSFPFLQRYAALVGRDALLMYHSISVIYEANQLEEVSYLELERLGSSIAGLQGKERAKPSGADETSDGTVNQPTLKTYSPIKWRNLETVEDLEGSYVPFRA